MRRALPSALFSAALTLVATANLYAQNDRFAYAITDANKEGTGWNVLRRFDLETGQYTDALVNGTDSKLAVYDAVSKKQLTLSPDARYGNLLQTPFSTGVAAATYDY